uniref:PremRNAsplicing factor SYF1 putative n=1 Tax=Albugo laibachii Nc14 TaxID=890382 RepID=F0W9Z6_9STRA|nr:premRNAsplicing factor SYF1 putative [Albugo laibachii Nc14]|eukprot:CCA17964.1 premRNAsplicing factor SYF1 putative [Albugo laibachii Nc14]
MSNRIFYPFRIMAVVVMAAQADIPAKGTQAVGLEFGEFFEYEEEVCRRPYDIHGWLRYLGVISATMQSRDLSTLRDQTYERALKVTPRSYKLWKMYLDEKGLKLRGKRIDSTEFEALIHSYERCLMHLSRMPRIWLNYVALLQHLRRITQTRHVLDRALRVLPITQHKRIWTIYLEFACDSGIHSLGIRTYERYLQLEPSKSEDFVEYLVSIKNYRQASLQLVKILDEAERILPNKSLHALWMELCDIISLYPDQLENSLNVEEILRSGMKRFTDEVGRLWCSLATYYIRLGSFESARNIYEEGIQTVLTVRDFSMIYDAYVQFLEAMTTAEMRVAEEEPEESESSDPNRSHVDRLLQIYEQVADRRPLLLNSVLLRQNPHNVREWEKRIAFYAEKAPLKAIQTYAEAVKTIKPQKARGKLHGLWIKFANFYDQHGRLEDARTIFSKATEVAYRSDEELAGIYTAWVELELRHECFDEALELARSACTMEEDAKAVLRKRSAFTTRQRLHTNVSIWKLRLDLEESLGDYKSTREAYEKAFELRIITAQMIINYAAYLEEHKYFEDSFRAFERGLDIFPKFPHARALWDTYLTKFVDRYKESKLERARDLYEQAVKAVPITAAKDFYLKYIDFEEKCGMLRNVMALFDRATDEIGQASCSSTGQDQMEMFQLYVQKAQKYFGVAKVREVYQRGIDKLPDAFVVPLCLSFSTLEIKLGEIDRARAIYTHASQFADPRKHEDTFWKLWHDFEVAHGSELTFLEMLRVKRSVVALYAHVNYHIADVVPALEANGNAFVGGNPSSARYPVDAMSSLETQLNEQRDVVSGSKRSAESLDMDEARNSKKEKVEAVLNEEEIDLDDLQDEEIEAMGREAFEAFLEDFDAVREDTLKQLDEYRESANSEQRHTLDAAIATSIEKLGNHIRLLENETKGVSGTERRQLMEKTRKCKSQIASLKSEVERVKLLSDAKGPENASSESTSTAKDQMLQYQNRLDRTGRHLDQTQQTLAETEAIATNVANNLLTQRNQLQHAEIDVGSRMYCFDWLLLNSLSQVSQTDEDARDAGRHLRRLTIKAITNKVVLSLLILILIAAVIFLSVYKWYPGAKEAIRGKPSTNTNANTTRLLESQISCYPWHHFSLNSAFGLVFKQYPAFDWFSLHPNPLSIASERSRCGTSDVIRHLRHVNRHSDLQSCCIQLMARQAQHLSYPLPSILFRVRREQSGPPDLESIQTVPSYRLYEASRKFGNDSNEPSPTPCHWNGADEWQMNSHHRRAREGRILLDLHERVRNDAVLQLTTVEIEDILQQVLGIVSSNSKLRHEEITPMLVSLAEILPVRSGLLCSEFVHLLRKCYKKKHPVFFSHGQLVSVLDFLLEFITTGASWYSSSAIKALGLILEENIDRVGVQELNHLFDVLLKYMEPSEVNVEARYAATTCFSTICTLASKTPTLKPKFSVLLRMIVENIRQQVSRITLEKTDDRILIKACTCSISCVYLIATSGNAKAMAAQFETIVPGLMTSIRPIIGRGLDVKGDSDPPGLRHWKTSTSPNANMTENMRTEDQVLLAHMRVTILKLLEAITLKFSRLVTSSMGLYLPEQSSPYLTLYGNSPSILTLLIADTCERARVGAARFLEVLWETVPVTEYLRHPSSCMDSTFSFASMPKRISLMLYQVHATLVHSMQHEKDLVTMTQILKTATSVVQICPYPSISNILRKCELNAAFSDVLTACFSSVYAIIVSANDHSVRLAAFSCLTAVLSIQSFDVVLNWLTSKSKRTRGIKVSNLSLVCESSSSSVPNKSLVEDILRIAQRSDSSDRPISRLEAMSLLPKIARNYSTAMSDNWHALVEFLLTSFQDVDSNIRVQAIKILEAYMKSEVSRSEGISEQWNGTVNPRARANSIGAIISPRPGNARARAGSLGNLPRGEYAVGRTSFKQSASIQDDFLEDNRLKLMSGHLMRGFSDPSYHVRTGVCSCFTLLRPRDWIRLEKMLRAKRSPNAPKSLESWNVENWDGFIRVLFQACKDNSPVVRAAAFRLVGSMSLTPALKIESFACEVISLAMEALEDATLNVRIKAAWALGNVCTTIGPEVAILETLKSTSPSRSELKRQSRAILSELLENTKQLLLFDLLQADRMRRIIEKMLICITDHDKVASSVVRALGLVCRWICFEPFRSKLSGNLVHKLDSLLDETMLVLSSKVSNGSPKVRWNACHAIAKILLCPALPLALIPWAPVVFQALINAISQQDNFKVRISACGALRVSSSRSGMGAFYAPALRAIVDALETASDLKDVIEFRYKEQLETQLSFTLTHLLHIATQDDHALVWEVLTTKSAGFFFDWLFHNMNRMLSVVEEQEMKHHKETDTEHLEDEQSSSGLATSEVHDATPIRKEEILSAVRVLLQVLHQNDPNRVYVASGCISILYDTKLGLEQ